MAEIASWNGHSFTISPTLIRGFSGLTIKGGSETKDKTKSKQKYVSRKNSIPSEVTMTAELNAFTGCDVQNEALKFVEEARAGASNYFYMGGKKLVACKLMLTEASISEVQIAPGGAWTACNVSLTMKQCAKYDSESSSTSSKKSSSKKTSTKKKSTTTTKKATTTKKTTTTTTAKPERTAANSKAKSAAIAKEAKQKVGIIAASTAAAKKQSSSTKKTSTANKVITGRQKGRAAENQIG